MVVSIWQTVEEWMRWQESAQRKAVDKELERLLIEPAEYGVFELVSTKPWSLILKVDQDKGNGSAGCYPVFPCSNHSPD